MTSALRSVIASQFWKVDFQLSRLNLIARPDIVCACGYDATKEWAMSGNTSGDETACAFDPKAEAKRIAFDRSGNGEDVLLISGFPQTRRSWRKLVPLLSKDFQTVAADLPNFGDSGLLPVPATTENVGTIFHEFAANLRTPLHVVAHDFGAAI
jgi:pimeloyl-ACP methyl ester carboxylesterase